MWIRIDRMRFRIHKIWSTWIRIQDNKITKINFEPSFKVKKKTIFSNLYLNLRDITFLASDLKNMIPYKKKSPDPNKTCNDEK